MVRFINRTICIAALFVLPALLLAQDRTAAPQGPAQSFPGPDFVLRDKGGGGTVLGPFEDDGKGGTKGSVAVYGEDFSLLHVGSLSFSGDGRILAAGTNSGRVDLWDVDNHQKLGSLQGGATVALSPDGRVLAMDGNGIQLCDLATRTLKKRIPWATATPTPGVQNTITRLTFNPAGTLLLVTANAQDDSVYDVASGKLAATLTDTKHAQFSQDGSLLIGGNDKHVILWNTKDWSKVRDLPNGPDNVNAIAASPEKDLVVVGGPKGVRLIRLSSGEEIAQLGTGNTNFAAFSQSGSLIFTSLGGGFAVWDASGREYCSSAHLGNGSLALSPNDRWLAAPPENGGTNVAIWNLQSTLDACGLPIAAKARATMAAGSPSSANAAVPAPRLPPGLRGAGEEVVQKVRAMKPEEFAAVQSKATGGDAEAQAMVCIAYRLGRFVPQDDALALNWCEKAAIQNNFFAEQDVGLQYAAGIGVKADTPRGLEWLKKAASLGSVLAMSNLGTMYANGAGVPQDFAEAMKWYHMGADHGDPCSGTDIGIMYLNGEGVQRDPAEALHWFRKSADEGCANAGFTLGMLYQQGLGVPQDVKESLNGFTKGAELGDARAQTELGWVYAQGAGVKPDYAAAVRWYRLAAQQGDPRGAFGLAVRYLAGQGVDPDYAEAEKWLLAAARAGHGDAAYNLGLLYLHHFPGQTGAPDAEKAAKYFRMAADQGIADGQCYLGTLYSEGSGLAKDAVLAYQWMLLASQAGAEQCRQPLKTLETQMKADQVEEAKRRAAAWKPQPHPGFTY
jgi:hypothetical protein